MASPREAGLERDGRSDLAVLPKPTGSLGVRRRRVWGAFSCGENMLRLRGRKFPLASGKAKGPKGGSVQRGAGSEPGLMRQWDPLGILLVEGHTEWAE